MTWWQRRIIWLEFSADLTICHYEENIANYCHQTKQRHRHYSDPPVGGGGGQRERECEREGERERERTRSKMSNCGWELRRVVTVSGYCQHWSLWSLISSEWWVVRSESSSTRSVILWRCWSPVILRYPRHVVGYITHSCWTSLTLRIILLIAAEQA